MKGRAELAFYVSVVTGIALGTSTFMMISGLFEVAAPLWIIVAIVASGAVCGAIALSVGELAGMYPSAPAIRTYFKVAFSDSSSLFFVYLYLVFIVLIAGVESYMFALVTNALYPGASDMTVIVILIAVIVGTNLLGLELPRVAQMVLAFAAVALLGVAGAVAIVQAPGGAVRGLNAGDVGEGLLNLPATIGLGIFLFMGFEWVTPLGLRPKSYERAVPVSMPLSIAILVALYVVFVVGLAATMGGGAIASTRTPQLPFFAALFGELGRPAAWALSLSAIASTFNAGLMGGSRLVLAVAREGNLPRWCATQSLRTGAPTGAVLLLGILALGSSGVVVSYGLELTAAVISASIICLVYAGYLVATERLRRSDSARPRPFRSSVPRWARSGVIGLLVVIGVATVFSVPEEGARPAVGLAGAIGVAVVSARVFRRAPAQGGPREPLGQRSPASP